MIEGSFVDWLKDFIPRKDNPNDCEIINVKITYREVYFTYRMPNGEEKDDSLMIELY